MAAHCQWLSEGLSALTINRGEHHSGVVIGDDVCIAVLWLVDFHVGVLPGKLLAWINGLWECRDEKREVRWRENNYKRVGTESRSEKIIKTQREALECNTSQGNKRGKWQCCVLSATLKLCTVDNNGFKRNIRPHHVTWKATAECYRLVVL